LAEHYPGINLNIFLRDLRDILRFRFHHELMDLDQSYYSLSEVEQLSLASEFSRGVPLAVLMGFSEFYHHQVYVNQHVLVPRPETEYMVDLLVTQGQGKISRLLDVGTGSGVILLSLLKAGVGRSGLGVDLSPLALEVAQINIRRLRLETKASLQLSDRLENVEGTFDLIVSNPPYIKASSHRSLVHASVDKHEPHQALYLPDETYSSWFKEFFQQVRHHLKGLFMMEGHELELDDQAKMLEELGFQKVEVLKDLSGAKRFLRAEFSASM
jgi:release factor glutamine methyltransferase